MSRFFENQSNLPVEISPIKQQLLWDQIILEWLNNISTDYVNKSKKFQDHNFLEISSLTTLDSWHLAYKAREAFAILQIYQISIESIKTYAFRKDTKIFLDWLEIYTAFCSKFNYYNAVPEVNFNKMNLPTKTAITNINSANIFKTACQDINQEFNYAASFILVNGIKKSTIVVLNLEENYNKINYVFSNYFKQDEYEIYLSPKLSESYIIKLCLLILQLANCYIIKENFKYEEFSKLLRTKYISGSSKETHSRVYIDYVLREKIDYKFDWEYIINYLSNNLTKDSIESINVFINLCFSFRSVLNSHINSLSQKQSCDFWIVFIDQILTAFGWCVEVEELNPQEQQIVNCWHDLLDLYKESQVFIKPHDFSECVIALNKLAQVYKVKNNFNQSANVSIMDLKTALQNKFDCLWICGFDELNWPLEYDLNPFLPTEIQKEIGLPCGSLKNSKLIFQQLIYNTNNIVVCSYPIYIDGNLVRSSNLIKNFAELSSNFNISLACDLKFPQTINKLQLESYIDERAPKYEVPVLPGTQVFKMQNACPFQANAKIRLKAKKFVIPVPYLSKALKGEILHKTLASFWTSYINLSNLSNYYLLKDFSDSSVREKLFNIAYKIINDLRRFKPTTLNKLTIDLEVNRIVDLCFNFIKKYDLSRKDFKVIYIENKFTVKLKEYLINIKIDRIDQLSNGDLIIIDYKTGHAIDLADFKLFDVNKINNPQFIVYSLCSKKVKALILANIRADELKLFGAIDNQANLGELNNLPDFKYIAIDGWQQHLNNCYESLYALAKNFSNGEAKVHPKQGNATCNKCDLHSMCRIYIDSDPNLI